MQNRVTGNTAVRSSDFVIRISGFDERIMRGAIEHSGTGDYMEFYGLVDLIEAIQDRLDELSYPQATMELRSWRLPSPYPAGVVESGHDSEMSPDENPFENPPWNRETSKHKTQSSFILRIQFRHNACWQGSLAWMEAKKTMAFRSLLELISLMSSALDAVGGAQGSGPWKSSPDWRAAATVS